MRATRSAAGLPALAALLLLAACGSPAVGGPTADAPISAPNEQWTWIDFPDAVCGSGQATGLGVNKTDRTTDVVIYLMGGGACWSEETCVTNPVASFLDGFTGFHFAFASIGFTNTPLDRNLAGNPFAGASFAFIPYCTGDLHAGDAVTTYGTRTIHHAGHANTAAFLRRLAPTFTGARRIFLVGSSAGGYGAQLNYEAVVAAFPEAQVHLLADGAQLVAPAGALWDAWKAAWNTPLPEACAACASEPGALVSYLATTFPSRRFGLLASMQDDVLRGYFGYDGAGFSAVTQSLLDAAYTAGGTPWPEGGNARFFALDTARHTMLDLLMTTVGPAPQNVPLVDWVTAWRDGTPGWVNVGP